MVELCEFALGGGEADTQAFGLADPALAICFGDAQREVVANLLKPTTLSWVDPQDRAADAAVLMLTAGSICSAAFAERDLASLEMSEEFFPFGVGGCPVFFTRTQSSAACYECAVAVDRFLGIDRLVAHCCGYMLVAQQ